MSAILQLTPGNVIYDAENRAKRQIDATAQDSNH